MPVFLKSDQPSTSLKSPHRDKPKSAVFCGSNGLKTTQNWPECSPNRQREKNGPGSVEPAPVTPRGCTKMVPPRLARKMSVMSVEPPARGAPGGTAAERVHRPGSRRLGGVEATGASPGVAASRPHRSDPRAGPVRRTPAHAAPGGGSAPGAGPPTCLRRSKKAEGGGLQCRRRWMSAPTRSFVRRGRWGKRVPDTLYRNAPRASRQDGPKNRKNPSRWPPTLLDGVPIARALR